MRSVLVVGPFIAALLLGAGPAAAGGVAPWCAEVTAGYNNVIRECIYRSLDACRPNVLAGNRGFCIKNPAWPGWYGPPERPRHHARRNPRHR